MEPNHGSRSRARDTRSKAAGDASLTQPIDDGETWLLQASNLEAETTVDVDLRPAPLNHPPALIRAWFDDAADAVVPLHDGTLATARRAADAYV